MKTKKTKKAFTLVEVMVTMAVLGIIASIVVPTLINITNKITYVDALKRAYLILRTATNQIMLDNGGTLVNAFTGDTDMMNKYCTKLSCIKKCDTGTGSGVCFHALGKWSWLGGEVSTYDANTGGPRMVLSNGMLLSAGIQYGDSTCSGGGNDNDYIDNWVDIACTSIWVDVNGFKGPNQFGRDIFTFRLTRKGLYPDGLKGFTDWGAYCNASHTWVLNGLACSGKILTEGAMNY